MRINNYSATFSYSWGDRNDVEVTLETSMTLEEYNQYFGGEVPYIIGDDMVLLKKPDSCPLKLQAATITNNKRKNPLFSGYYNINGKDTYITKVIYNKPAVIIIWSDGTKTKSICDKNDVWNPEMGLALAVLKKFIGTKETSRLYEDWGVDSCMEEETITLKTVRNSHKFKDKHN